MAPILRGPSPNLHNHLLWDKKHFLLTHWYNEWVGGSHYVPVTENLVNNWLICCEIPVIWFDFKMWLPLKLCYRQYSKWVSIFVLSFWHVVYNADDCCVLAIYREYNVYSSDELFQRSRQDCIATRGINIPVNTETVQYESTYINIFLSRHNGSIKRR